jgi:hypothetical protein
VTDTLKETRFLFIDLLASKLAELLCEL